MGLFGGRRRDRRQPAEEDEALLDDLDALEDDPVEEDDDPYDDDDDYDTPRRGLLATVLRGVSAGLVAAAVIGVIWFAYNWGIGTRPQQQAQLPMITAEDRPEKVRPDDPGGMDVPYQDKLVLNNRGQSAQGARVERLLPPPENPQPPESEPSATAGGGAREPDSRNAPTPETARDGSASTDAANTGPPDRSTARGRDAGGADGTGTQASAAPEIPPESEASTTSDAAEPAGSDNDSGTEAAADERPVSDTREPAETQQTQATAPPPRPQPGDPLVQLAALQSREAAERAWADLRVKFPNVLGDQRLVLQRVDKQDGSVFWRVRTGPFPNRTTAADVCGQLKAAGQACLVVSQ